MNRELDFFISYSNQDVDRVSKVVTALTEYGAQSWFQEKDSRAEFVEAIMGGIEEAKAFVVFISPSSANSFFVLNEVNHAVEWQQSHESYQIIPVVLGQGEIGDPAYKKMRFYLGRLNMLFYRDEDSPEALALKIFEQAGMEIRDETLRQSLYHTSGIEEKRLRAQNEVLCGFPKEFFARTVTPGSYLLDIGCAAGDNMAMRLGELAYTGLLGIDVDAEQIEKARRTYGSPQNTYEVCDVTSDRLVDVLDDYLEVHETIGFDLIHVSAVLLHLAEPVKLLRMLRRFLKKKGVLLIQDEDDGANLVYPNSRFFDRAFAIWADSKESGDRHCGRKIPSYLSEAGYGHISLEKCGVSSAGMSKEERTALWDIYFNHHYWLAVEENTFYNLAKTNQLLDEYRAEYEWYKKEYDDGKIFIQLGFLFFTARK